MSILAEKEEGKVDLCHQHRSGKRIQGFPLMTEQYPLCLGSLQGDLRE